MKKEYINLPYYIAKRIYSNDKKEDRISRPAVVIAMCGIALGLAVMIISVFIVIGFKSEIRNKMLGVSSAINITNVGGGGYNHSLPINKTDSLMNVLGSVEGVKNIQRYSLSQGIIKTDESFNGVMLKGVGQEFDTLFFSKHIVEGRMPFLNDTVSSREVVISRMIAKKMKLKVGDRVESYHISNSVRGRKFTVVGIYDTNLAEFDDKFIITDIYTVNRLNGFSGKSAFGLEINVSSFEDIESVHTAVSDLIYSSDNEDEIYSVVSVTQSSPQIFDWLELLDINVWVILALMIGVSGFTMISGLLIIIIERTQMIGLMKSLGADNETIRHTFLWLSVFIIGKSMIIGNIIALVLCFMQGQFHIIKLNPETYYIDNVPIEFSLFALVGINLISFVCSIAMLLIPSFIVSKVEPATSMRYE